MGHAGDGNLHPSVYHEHTPDRHDEIEKLVYDMTGEFDGSVSAEHGIGMLKQPVSEDEPHRGGNRNHAHAETRARPEQHSEPRTHFHVVRRSWALEPDPGSSSTAPHPLKSYCLARWSPIWTSIATHSGKPGLATVASSAWARNSQVTIADAPRWRCHRDNPDAPSTRLAPSK